MQRDGSGPLTDTDYAKINEHMYALDRIRADTEKAMQAGFDCAPEDMRCKKALAQYAAIKAAYFPERP